MVKGRKLTIINVQFGDKMICSPKRKLKNDLLDYCQNSGNWYKVQLNSSCCTLLLSRRSSIPPDNCCYFNWPKLVRAMWACFLSFLYREFTKFVAVCLGLVNCFWPRRRKNPIFYIDVRPLCESSGVEIGGQTRSITVYEIFRIIYSAFDRLLVGVIAITHILKLEI